MNPDVSIVVCTYNRAIMLRDCLESLLAQETAGEFTFEVVVVDNRSTDQTGEVVLQLRESAVVPLIYELELTPGQVHARHKGFDVARGEWIANFDDDEVAEPDWLLEMLRLAREKQTRSVGGRLLLRFQDPTDRRLHPRVRRMLGESVLWDEPRPYTRRQGPGSGNQLLHRSVFDEVGRYDLSYQKRGYDTDLYRRICEAGIVSWFAPKAVAYHITPANRLRFSYLDATCLHDGWCFSRRDVEHYGKLRCAGILAARAAKAIGYHAPLAAATRIAGKQETALAHWLTCRRTEGYMRGYLFQAARWLPQDQFLDRYDLHELTPVVTDESVHSPSGRVGLSGPEREPR